MLSSVTGFVYPWDVVGDPAAADRFAASGVDAVNLPAVYHAVRADTPVHPDHRVVIASHSAYYTRRHPEAWRNAAIVAKPATSWAGQADSFGRARDALTSAGLTVSAWVVLIHSDHLVEETSPYLVRNAFGDPYDYALCPGRLEVREYATALVAQTVAQAGVDSVLLESCGPFGFDHLSEHDKAAGSDWNSFDKALLSLCFCEACREEYGETGIDADRLARLVRDAIGTHREFPDVQTGLCKLLGQETTSQLLSARRAQVERLRDAVTKQARASGVSRIGFQATSDPWGGGFSAPVLSRGADLDLALVNCGSSMTGVTALTSACRDIAEHALRAKTGAFVSILDDDAGVDSEAWYRHWSALVRGGADELHLYHLGLASPERLSLATRALVRLREQA